MLPPKIQPSPETPTSVAWSIKSSGRLSLAGAAFYGAFFVSGLAALLYQLTWQRALMLIYGTNTESVAMVVSSFLVGLGLGSLAGGQASRQARFSPLLLFALAEFGVGTYGFFSLKLFEWAALRTIQFGVLETGVVVFALVFLPTLLMGATLPLLVADQVRRTGHVGQSVSRLYFVNTLGAGLGAFLAAFYVLGQFGLSGAAQLAAVLNVSLGATVSLVCWLPARMKP